jgi:hypothetical protein
MRRARRTSTADAGPLHVEREEGGDEARASGAPPNVEKRHSRRDLLKGGVSTLARTAVPAFLLAGSRAFAIGPGSQVGIGQIIVDGASESRPEAARRLLWETGRRTSIDVAREATRVKIADPALFEQPLLVWTGSGPFAELPAKERALLVKHLRMGGLLWVDGQSRDDGFIDAVRRELLAMFPREKLAPLEKDHVLYKSYYILDGVVGRTADEKRAAGIEIAQRLLVVVTECDVLGALERDRFGTWRFECEPGGERQRERALRFGVNLLMVATCLDYKSDQVHIPFIMKKKRR